MTPIKAFGEEEPFKSIEHAFFWKMATDLGLHHLADRIKNAMHAGVVKRLSKEMDERERITWEDMHQNIMKELLQEKAKSCELFKQCILMNQDKILAESTFNKRWGTGLTKRLTELTKPQYWPGNNMLGVMLMELTTHSVSCNSMEINDPPETTQKPDEDTESEAESDLDQDASPEVTAEETTIVEQAEKQDSINEQAEKQGSINATSIISDTQNKDKEKKKPRRKKMKYSATTKNGVQNVFAGKKTNNNATEKERRIQNTPTIQQTIRDYLDPTTGKRKCPDTTPEKNNNEKKIIKE